MQGTVVSSDKILIHAPRELVWQVLVDFANYHKWNEFCPVAEGELTLDTPLKMQVDLGWGPQEQTEYICRIDPPQAVAWRMENKPGDPIHAVRTQTLTVVDENSCYYLSEDVFSGEAAADMLAQMAQNIETGFNLCGNCLKTYCETLFVEKV